MSYILWGLLNMVLSVFFAVVCVKATVLVRREIGLFAAIVFVFGIFSCNRTVDNDDNIEPGTNQIKTWKFNSADSVAMGSINYVDIDLQKTPISKYTLHITYGKDKQSQYYMPINAYALVTGFASGTSWKPDFIGINYSTENQKFEYDVIGAVSWKLFGSTFYRQRKNWKGIVLFK